MPPELSPARAWLFALQRFGVAPGLDRIRQLLGALDRPDQRFRSILVAGTNGKGSTASLLSGCLNASGRRVGLYTSPHLVHLNERIVIDGKPLDDALLDDALAEVRPIAERLGATFFEVITAAALFAFAEAAVDDAVLEVGLGGRFDATNVVTPSLSLITGVALDHTAVLGPDLASIAREKAGIVRPGVPAFSAAVGEARAALFAAAADLGVSLRMLTEGVDHTVEDRGWAGVAVRVLSAEEELELVCSLVGRHQGGNVALAAFGAASLGVPPGAIRTGVARAVWPGRLERVRYRGRYVVLDGAHNPESASALASALRRLEGRVPLMIVGMSADKDVEGVGHVLAPVADHLVATRSRLSPRALDPEALALHLPADGVSAGLSAALRTGLDRVPRGGTIVVAGSLFLVGEARALLLGLEDEGMPRSQ